MNTITTITVNPLVESLEGSAKSFMNTYSCVIGTYGNFQLANDLYTDSRNMIEDGDIQIMNEKFFISECLENKNYQNYINAGDAELVSIGIPEDWFDLKKLSDITRSVQTHVPLEQVECFNVCAKTVDGTASYVPGEYDSICWNLASPIRLNNEEALLEWLDRVHDEFELPELTFLILRLPDGELFTVYGPRFDGWIYS